MPRIVLGTLFAGVITGGIVLVLFLNITGFCYPERRYYSAHELLEMAINYNLNKHNPSDERSKIYSSMAEFYDANPNCCKLYTAGHPNIEPLYDIIGLYNVVAEIWYKIKEAGADDFYRSYVYMNACGKVTKAQGILESRGPNPLYK